MNKYEVGAAQVETNLFTDASNKHIFCHNAHCEEFPECELIESIKKKKELNSKRIRVSVFFLIGFIFTIMVLAVVQKMVGNNISNGTYALVSFLTLFIYIFLFGSFLKIKNRGG